MRWWVNQLSSQHLHPVDPEPTLLDPQACLTVNLPMPPTNSERIRNLMIQVGCPSPYKGSEEQFDCNRMIAYKCQSGRQGRKSENINGIFEH